MNDASKATNPASGMMHDVADDADRMFAQVKQFGKRVNRQDTISTLLVVGLTILAVILGALLWNSVVNRTTTYTDAAKLQITYPAGWVLSDTGAETSTAGQITVSNQKAGIAPTKFEIQRAAVDASSPVTSSLALIANGLTATRARNLSSYKVLGTEAFTGSGADKKPIQIKGLPGYKTSFVYVNTPSNALQGNIPSVMLGEDWLVLKGDKVYVFTLHSTQANRDTALPLFEKFVDSAQLP
jgi:hypothetical protein